MRATLGVDTLEARWLAAAAPRVTRAGCDLAFRDSLGRDELVLSDVLQEGDPWVLHRYRGPVPALGAHLVERSFYEGGGYLLVYPGGAPVFVAGPPLVSPDSTRFVTWQQDLVAEYDPNVIQVWRRTPAAARLELAIASEDWGPSEVRWLDATTVAFVQNFPAEDVERPAQRAARLMLRAGRWMAELQAR